MKREDIKLGIIVKSLAGHDKDNLYILNQIIDENFVFVVDGKYKTIEKQKRKKIKHLLLMGISDEEFVSKLNISKVMNCEIINQIKQFKKGVI